MVSALVLTFTDLLGVLGTAPKISLEPAVRVLTALSSLTAPLVGIFSVFIVSFAVMPHAIN